MRPALSYSWLWRRVLAPELAPAFKIGHLHVQRKNTGTRDCTVLQRQAHDGHHKYPRVHAKHQVKHGPYRRRVYRSLEMRWRVCVRAGGQQAAWQDVTVSRDTMWLIRRSGTRQLHAGQALVMQRSALVLRVARSSTVATGRAGSGRHSPSHWRAQPTGGLQGRASVALGSKYGLPQSRYATVPARVPTDARRWVLSALAPEIHTTTATSAWRERVLI